MCHKSATYPQNRPSIDFGEVGGMTAHPMRDMAKVENYSDSYDG